MKILTRSLLAFLLPLLLLPGCAMETEVSPDQRGDEARVTFRVELPAHAKPTATRATVGTENENAVNNIYVLAFDKSDKFAYYKQVTSVSDVNTSQNKREKTFTVSLRVSEGSSDTYTFVLLANVDSGTAGQIATALSQKKDKATTLASLTHTAATAPKTNIPMASPSTTATEVTASTAFSGIKLVRMAARVDVTTALANFRIAEVNLYDYNTCGKVVSSQLNASHVATAVDLPNAPALATAPTVAANASTDLKKFESQLYSYETAAASDPCLVVKLEYSADGTTNWIDYGYYKMRFVQNKSAVDIKRNTRYIFNISSVAGTGFPNKDDAYKSEPVGIGSDVIEWDDADMGGIIVNGNYFLAVGPTEFDLWKNTSDQLVKVASNLPIVNGVQWKAEVFADAQDTSDDIEEWLMLYDNKGGADYTDAKKKSELNFAVAENTGTAPRTAWIHIKGGNVVFKVRVTQSHETAPSTTVPYITVTGIESSYAADGATEYTLTVKSNVPWTAAATTGDTAVKSHTTAGGPDEDGETFKFVLNELSTAGSVVFAFKSADETFTRNVTVNYIAGVLALDSYSATVTCAADGIAEATRTFTVTESPVPFDQLTLTPSGAATDATIDTDTGVVTVTVAAATASAQTGSVVVSAGALSKTFSVTREEPTLTLSAASATLANSTAATTATTQVTSNCDVSLITVAKTSGTATAQSINASKLVSVTMPASTARAASSVITISIGDIISKTFTVTKTGFAVDVNGVLTLSSVLFAHIDNGIEQCRDYLGGRLATVAEYKRMYPTWQEFVNGGFSYLGVLCADFYYDAYGRRYIRYFEWEFSHAGHYASVNLIPYGTEYQEGYYRCVYDEE